MRRAFLSLRRSRDRGQVAVFIVERVGEAEGGDVVAPVVPW